MSNSESHFLFLGERTDSQSTRFLVNSITTVPFRFISSSNSLSNQLRQALLSFIMTTSRNWLLLVILVFQLFCTNMLACALLATTTTDIVAVDPEVHEYKFPDAGWT